MFIKKFQIHTSVVLSIFTIIVTFLCLRYISSPYIWIGLTLFFLILYFSIISHRKALKVILVNLSAVILAFTIFEAFVGLKTVQETKTVYNEKSKYNKPLTKSSDFFGYAPNKNNKVTVSKYFKDKLIYEVTYNIDGNGLRESQDPISSNFPDGCVLFFGGSFTFGEGVNDNETLPFHVGEKTRENERKIPNI